MKRTALAAAVAVMSAGIAQAAVTELRIYKEPNFRGESRTIKGEVANLEGFTREVESLVAVGGYWEVCTRDHFKGECRVLEPGEYRRLDADLNRRIVSTRFLGTEERWARRAEREGRFYAQDDRRRERREARREERREERRWEYSRGSLDLYGRPGFRGRAIRIEDDMDSLRGTGFDGRASSVIVHEGTWQMCSEPRFGGVCGVFGPGQYPRIAQLDDRVSSMRQIR